MLSKLVIYTSNSEIEIEFKYDLIIDRMDDINKLIANLCNMIYLLIDKLHNNNSITPSREVNNHSQLSNNMGKEIGIKNVNAEKRVDGTQDTISKCATKLLIHYRKGEGESFTIVTRNRMISNIDKYGQLQEHLRNLGFRQKEIKRINIMINEELRKLAKGTIESIATSEICLDNINELIKESSNINKSYILRDSLTYNCLNTVTFNELAKGGLKTCTENIAGKKVLFLSKLFSIDYVTACRDAEVIVYVGKRSNGLFEVVVRNLNDTSGNEYVFQQDTGISLDAFVMGLMEHLSRLLNLNKVSVNIKSAEVSAGQKGSIGKKKKITMTRQGIILMPECPRCGAKMSLDILAGQPRTFEGYTKPRYVCTNCGFVMQA